MLHFDTVYIIRYFLKQQTKALPVQMFRYV